MPVYFRFDSTKLAIRSSVSRFCGPTSCAANSNPKVSSRKATSFRVASESRILPLISGRVVRELVRILPLEELLEDVAAHLILDLVPVHLPSRVSFDAANGGVEAVGHELMPDRVRMVVPGGDLQLFGVRDRRRPRTGRA